MNLEKSDTYETDNENALHEDAGHLQNGSRTCEGFDTRLTQPVSLSVLADDLTRLRPGHPAGAHISLLIGQLKNYERNPVLLKPAILMTVQRIEEARS